MFVFNVILSLSCFLYTERSCLLFAGVEGQLETQFPSPLPSSHWSLVITHNYMEACIRLYYNAWQCALSKLEICIWIRGGKKKTLKCHSGHFIYIQRILSFLETASLLRSESKILKHKEARVRGEGLCILGWYFSSPPPSLSNQLGRWFLSNQAGQALATWSA